jgi:hypothetical protein
LPDGWADCTLEGVSGRTGEGGGGTTTTAFFGALVILSSMALAVVGLAVVQRLVPLSLRKSHNVATGTIYAAVYVMFGVTLAFSLFLVWHLYDAA